MSTKSWMLGFLIVALMLTACGADKTADAAKSLEGEWVLQTLNGAPLLSGAAITALFEGGTISGYSGCNSYSGPYTVKGATFKPGEVAATLMACMEDGVMEQEQAYFEALSNAAKFRLTGDRLELLDKSGAAILVYARLDTSLAGTAWTLTAIIEGEAATSPLADTEITLEFDAEQVSGTAGCNRYFGPYTLEEGQLSFGALGLTRMYCEMPEGTMEQEASYTDILSAATVVERSANRLTLRTTDGRGLVFAPQP